MSLSRARPLFLRAALPRPGIAAIIWFFYWSVRTSGGFEAPGEKYYYNFLVQGWHQGHLHMSKEPRPEMLALADPYDPAQNSNVRMGDASYFRGHYYLYFGAAPAAVLMLPWHALTGRELGTTTAIFIFCTIGFLAASGLWLAIRRKYFPASARWVGLAGVVLLGLASHAFVLPREPFVWELAIAAGYAFAMLALAGIYWALHGKRPALALGLSGFAMTLAVGSRPTCLMGTAMFLPALWHLRCTLADRAQWWRCVAALSVGLGVCLLAITAHNFARFGNALEFGQNFQLSGVYESKMRHFRLAYVPYNFGIYFLQLPGWTREFPFISANAVHGGPDGYLGGWNGPVCGLAVTLPFLWLALTAPLACHETIAIDRAPLRAMLAALGIYFAVMAATILSYFLATPRYLADFTPALALLAAIGLLFAEGWAQRGGARKLALPLLATACFATAISGTLLSFDYHARAQRIRWANVESFSPRWSPSKTVVEPRPCNSSGLAFS